jgi:hypothetical protein
LCLDSLHNVVLCVVVVFITFFLLVLDIDFRNIITVQSKGLGDDLPLSERKLSLQLRSDPENIIQLSD